MCQPLNIDRWLTAPPEYPEEEDCEACEGSGWIDGDKCTTCHGTGKKPEWTREDQQLEEAGL
jgi:DnaJ-class molecular chaperone